MHGVFHPRKIIFILNCMQMDDKLKEKTMVFSYGAGCIYVG